ncbi:hypothetical protein PVK62_03840 [Aliivibrio sp. S3MY1]|uniref:hypothetical protein n=1 Tax=unclassified Aliivibrio TaxID=2645654 RepID=UPI002379D548|nr:MULTISPECIES: hypothetical protein [unclassified Aliivibrio]MDD9194964.1 hypothetical protein [Aliivibrio sp. S3MY1]MDD9198260.1 hypothetical protein [Aliivibrio sp. S2MY1]
MALYKVRGWAEGISVYMKGMGNMMQVAIISFALVLILAKITTEKNKYTDKESKAF